MSLFRDFEAMMVWLAEATLRVGEPYLVKHLSAQVKGVVRSVSHRVIRTRSTGRALRTVQGDLRHEAAGSKLVEVPVLGVR